MRVFLPSTFVGLRRLLETGELGPAPLPGFAVTAELRAWYCDGDDEELDLAALDLAARASVRLLDADPDAPRRRVVLVIEVDADLDGAVEPVPKVDRAAVRVTAVVPMDRVQAAYVDDTDAVADVTVAADAVVEADLGGEDAAFRVKQAEGHELMWFATQEIGALVELA